MKIEDIRLAPEEFESIDRDVLREDKEAIANTATDKAIKWILANVAKDGLGTWKFYRLSVETVEALKKLVK